MSIEKYYCSYSGFEINCSVEKEILIICIIPGNGNLLNNEKCMLGSNLTVRLNYVIN